MLADTMGLTHDTVEASVSARGLDAQARCWLVVQAYRGRDRARLHLARPVGAVVRPATGGELEAGLRVSVLALDEGDLADLVVVAWIERRLPATELDGIDARPARGIPMDAARASRDGVTTLRIEAGAGARGSRRLAA